MQTPPSLHEHLRTLLVPVLGSQTDDFLTAGLAAIATGSGHWVQLGIAPGFGRTPQLFGALDDLSTALLEDPSTTNFFFTRKPPGLQARFETTPDNRAPLEAELYARLNALRPTVELVVPGAYVPEERLFGGPAAMPHVHRLFTMDSRAWLAFHRASPGIPAWVFSLVLLRHLLEGLGINDDDALWTRIERQTGRTEAKPASVRAAWSDPVGLEASLPGPVAALATEWGAWLRSAASGWRDNLGDKDTTEAMASWTLAHWNRGGIPANTQAALVTALTPA